jgi:hypothetical protein
VNQQKKFELQRSMASWRKSSEFLNYLGAQASNNPDEIQLSSMNVLSDDLDLSVARLREQIEVAKALGFVDVRPRTGIRRLPYAFTPAVWKSLSYAMELLKLSRICDAM